MPKRHSGSAVVSILVVAILSACASSGPSRTPKAAPARPSPGAGLNYDQLLQAAQSYLDAGQPDGAADAARQATEKEPERPEGWVMWGRALAAGQQLEASAEKLEKARALGVKDRDLFATLASVYDVSERYPEAIATYDAYLAAQPKDAEMRQQLALTLLLAGEHARAIQELERCIAQAPDSIQLRDDLAYALLQAGRLDDAEKAVTAILKKEAKRPQALGTLARIRAAQGRLPEAIRILDQAINTSRRDPEPVRLRAKLKILVDDHAGALRDYEMLSKADPKDASALVGASGALIALGRLDDASQKVARAAQLIGQHPILGFRRAQIAWRRGEKGALTVLEQFARERPDSVEAWREVRAAAKKHGDATLLKEAKEKLAKLEH